MLYHQDCIEYNMARGECRTSFIQFWCLLTQPHLAVRQPVWNWHDIARIVSGDNLVLALLQMCKDKCKRERACEKTYFYRAIDYR